MIENAKWIWHSGEYEYNEYVDFVRDFHIDSADKNALLQISADSEYVLWINGEFVGCGQYSDFPEHKVFDEIPVGKCLKPGKNKICISAYYQGESSLRYKKGERGLIFALKNGDEVILSDKKTLCRVSQAYKNGEMHMTTWQMGFGFEYDAAQSDAFQKADYELNENWVNSTEKEVNTCLSIRPLKKNVMKETCAARIIAQGNFIRKCTEGTTADKMYSDYLSFSKFSELLDGNPCFPISVLQKDCDADGIYFVVDLGKERCGFLHFIVSAECGTRVDIAHGEHLDDLRVRSKIHVSAAIQDRNFADTYICREGKQAFTHYYRRIAGRYLQVHISGFTTLMVDYIGIKPVEYPFLDEAEFDCRDKIHNKIFTTALDTLKLCMHEHYEDCPWREQALYAMDARNAALSSYYAFGDFEFARASLDLLLQSLLQDTYLNLCAPAVRRSPIPSFTMSWLLAVKEYTEYSGDKTFAEEKWNTIKKMISAFCSNEQDGILKQLGIDGVDRVWSFYEWSSDYEAFKKVIKESKSEISDGLYHLFAYIGIRSAVRLAEIIGDVDFETKHTRILESMKEAFNRVFWDEKRSVFASHVSGGHGIRFDELTQSLAIYSGICDEERQEKALSSLLNVDNGLIKISLSNCIYKYEAILSRGMQYAKYVFDDIAEKWGNMLFGGATSFWETTRGSEDFNGAGSLCHAWSATPLYFYCKYILGVTAENGSWTISEKSAFGDVFAEYSGYVPRVGRIKK